MFFGRYGGKHLHISPDHGQEKPQSADSVFALKLILYLGKGCVPNCIFDAWYIGSETGHTFLAEGNTGNENMNMLKVSQRKLSAQSVWWLYGVEIVVLPVT
jgi:hypothetical protein